MQRRRVISAIGQGAGLSLLGGLGAVARAQPAGVKDNVIVLGQSAAFSGPAQQLGLQYHLGAMACFEAVNAKGGVHGRKIELRRLDDGYDPQRCEANTRQLLQENVFALFGYVGTPTTQVALPLATQAKVPLFAPLTGAESLRNPFDRHVVHIRASYNDETAAIVRQLTSVGIRRIAVFHQDDGYGQAGLAGVQAALKTLDLTPVSVGVVARNSTEVAAALKTILASRPEAIVQIGAYQACAVFVRQARRAGYTGNFYNVSFVGTQALLDELGAEAKGVAVSQVMPYPYSATTPIAAEYQAALKDKRGVVPNYSGMEGFVAAKLFTEVLRRAGRGLNRDSFLAALDGLQKLDLGGFVLEFGPGQRVGSRFVELTLLTADGRVRR
ncbi:MAG: ABC transporter substrate-binding protein [Hydrogenophaga sp.]|uniref:ABC transporter substrate-binding protein n=1 Tax=Hydrogenophaga sp. TaxID=1904254 RepID=UPI000EDEE5F0|nr:ABC transporter substrate-binding protein [Hydrogenophaga sp.]MDD3784691.1 ABC transporter substrate-binding protein [Hydrogenophaga sp.]HAJ13697.1 ABC transporter permease [Comamonadaceae bacterium]